MIKYKRGTRRRERVEIKNNPYPHIMKYEMTQLKHDIIIFLYEMRIATIEQIARKFSDYSLTWIRKNLLDLYENGFVYRKFKHVARGSSGGIYYLDNIGAFYIAANESIDKNDVKWDARDNAIGVEKINHTISITEIRVLLEEVKKETSCFKIVKFVGERQVGRIKYTFQGEQLEFNPDAELIIQNGKYISYYFIEYDSGTEGIAKITDKIKKYEGFYQSEEIKLLYPVEPEILIICENELSKHRFIKVLKTNKSIKDIGFYITTLDEFQQNPIGNCFIDIDTNENFSLVEEMK